MKILFGLAFYIGLAMMGYGAFLWSHTLGWLVMGLIVSIVSIGAYIAAKR